MGGEMGDRELALESGKESDGHEQHGDTRDEKPENANVLTKQVNANDDRESEIGAYHLASSLPCRE